MIFRSEEPLDILLNCVAMEFVTSIDEEFVHCSWWDPDMRYLKAGIVEMVVNYYINDRWCEHALTERLRSEVMKIDKNQRALHIHPRSFRMEAENDQKKEEEREIKEVMKCVYDTEEDDEKDQVDSQVRNDNPKKDPLLKIPEISLCR